MYILSPHTTYVIVGEVLPCLLFPKDSDINLTIFMIHDSDPQLYYCYY